ncbi:hypothetical protein QMK17_18110 [Rhodococcus sp. G-MC3]|nr:hypothetical protein [Rhodococcus sp. G-MC3]
MVGSRGGTGLVEAGLGGIVDAATEVADTEVGGGRPAVLDSKEVG